MIVETFSKAARHQTGAFPGAVFLSGRQRQELFAVDEYGGVFRLDVAEAVFVQPFQAALQTV